METKQQLIEELLSRGVEKVYPSTDFLRKKLESGEKLVVYLGADPSTPSLHIGHAIPLRKLALFQKLGHKVIFLLGDFTATIGDPDKLSVRVPLTREQVEENAKLYKSQAAKFIDFEGENPAELKQNSVWLDKLSFRDVISLAQHMTVQQMLERDMFQKRLNEERPIYLHEFLYPLMQGYDSVAMRVDGELGGNDQTFNMLAGRTLAKQLAGAEKFVLSTKLLADAEGVKMGKTTGNMISLTDTPEDMFGKVMSWTDGMIVPGFELCSDLPLEEIEGIKSELGNGTNPRDLKLRLAYELVKLYDSEAGAEKGRAHFVIAIQKKEIPDEIPEVEAGVGELLVEIVLRAKLAKSKSDYRRLLDEGAVSVRDGDKELPLSDPQFVVDRPLVVKIGKRRFLSIKIV